MKPQRITLSRKAGFNLQEVSKKLNSLPAVNCARPSRFGNPFKVHKIRDDDNIHEVMMDAQHGVCYSNEAAVRRFQRMVDADPSFRKQIRAKLRDHNLACWCGASEKWCHVSVLLKIANS